MKNGTEAAEASAPDVPPDAESVDGALVCKMCRKPRKRTPAVNVILLKTPWLVKPYRLLPAEDYTLCANGGCASVVQFIEAAINSHPEARTSIGANWHQVRLVFDDLDGWKITNGTYKPAAQA